MRKFKLFDEEGSYEYDVHVTEDEKGRLFELYRSNNSAWTHPESLIISMIDDGNCIKFREKIGKKIEYDFVVELRLILTVAAHIDCETGSQGKYSIIEASNEIIV